MGYNKKPPVSFRAMEEQARQRGLDMTQMGIAELDQLWKEIKADAETHCEEG